MINHSKKNTVLVAGSMSQLGQSLAYVCKQYSQVRCIFLDRSQFDITEPQMMKEAIERYNPDTILNCAAYTAVDKAEINQSLAYRINEEGVSNLALICKEKNIALIHISTDYVFDGKSTVPYTEEAATNPQTVYGASKRAGEESLLNSQLEKFAIIRTSWLYSPYGSNFLKTMLVLSQKNNEIKVVNDQLGSPTSGLDLARTLLDIIPNLSSENSGIYHYTGKGNTTWYGFAQEIFKRDVKMVTLTPVAATQFETLASRPKYSVLNCDKIESQFEVSTKNWKTSVAHVIDLLI